MFRYWRSVRQRTKEHCRTSNRHGWCASVQKPATELSRLEPSNTHVEHSEISVGPVLLVVLVLALIGIIPVWPHSKGWGYGPTGIVGFILLVLLILFIMGRM